MPAYWDFFGHVDFADQQPLCQRRSKTFVCAALADLEPGLRNPTAPILSNHC
jgi:hypothetical protein